MAFLERVMAGFWPVIMPSSAAAISNSLMLFSEAALPTQTFKTTFSTLGTRMAFLMSNFFIKAGTISLAYFSLRIVFVAILFFLIHYFAALFTSAIFLTAGQYLLGHPGRLSTFRANQLDIRNMKRQFFFDDAALRQLLGRPGMALRHIDLFDQDLFLLRENPNHAS